MRRRELEKIPRLQTLRHGFVKLEMIHQAGESWGGIVGRRFGAICKFKGKFQDARPAKRDGRYKLKNKSTSNGKRAGGTPALPKSVAGLDDADLVAW